MTGDRITRTCLLIAAVFCIGAAGVWFRGVKARDAGLNHGLVIPAADLLFGEEVAQADFQHQLRLRNNSSKELHIDSFSTSCGCSRVEPSGKITLAPDAEITLTVHLDLRVARTASKERLGTAPLAITIAPKIKVGKESVTGAGWGLSGTVRHLLALDPPAVVFGGADAPAGAERIEKTVLIRKDASVQDVHLIESSYKSVVVRLEHRPDGKEHLLHVTPAPGLPAGDFEETVRIQPRLADGVTSEEIALTIKGTKLPDIEAIPAAINFGVVQRGDERSATFVLRSTTGDAFSVQSWECNQDGIALTRMAPVDQGQSKNAEFRVNASFNSAGSHHAQLIITVHAANGNEVSMQIPIVAYAMQEKQT